MHPDLSGANPSPLAGLASRMLSAIIVSYQISRLKLLWTSQHLKVKIPLPCSSREVIRAYEFDVERRGTSRAMRFEVLITTYELILKDAPILGAIKWNYLMVDEAHRLKNADSALYQVRACRADLSGRRWGYGSGPGGGAGCV